MRGNRKPGASWNSEDRLTTATTPDGQLWRYLCDPLGRRIAKQKITDDGTILERVDFTWDGTNLAEQTPRSGGLPHAFTLTWEHVGAQPIAQYVRTEIGGGRRAAAGNRPAILRDHHRSGRHPHRPCGHGGRDRLADPCHRLGHDHLDHQQHGLHPAAVPRAALLMGRPTRTYPQVQTATSGRVFVRPVRGGRPLFTRIGQETQRRQSGIL
nr:RHS repeat domain-containing protein [Streptomyces noursei]